MALSNIFVEPRREITETIIGLAAVGGFLSLDYWLVSRLPWPSGADAGFFYFEMFGMAIILAAVFILLVLIHKLGDVLCNLFQRGGFDPRPAQRYSAKRRQND